MTGDAPGLPSRGEVSVLARGSGGSEALIAFED